VKNFIVLCAVFSACATAAPRPQLIEPRQVIETPDYLTASAAAGDAIVAISANAAPGNTSQSLVQATLYLRDASGVYQSQGVLFSETGRAPIHAVAMSPTVIALGMPSGLHVFRRNSAGAFVEVIVDGPRPAAMHVAVGADGTVLASESPCNWSVTVLGRSANGHWTPRATLPGRARPCDQYNFGLAGEFDIDGDRAVVWNGDPTYDTTATEARVFDRVGGTWTQTATITEPPGSERYSWQFGPSLAVANDDIFITGSTRGTHHFHWNGSTWADVEQLRDYDGWRGFYIHGVTVSGPWLAQVSASEARGEFDVAHVFYKTASGWRQNAMLAVGEHEYLAEVSIAGQRAIARGRALYIYDLPAGGPPSLPTFQDDFESGAQASWTPIAGSQWSVVAAGGTHVYRQSNSVSHAGAIESRDLVDQSIAADITPRVFQGPDRWVGLVTRYTDESNYYYVTLRDRDRLVLRKLVDGVVTELGRVNVLVNVNQPYRLQLESSGSLQTVYFDGVRVLSAFDSSLAHGHAGLRMYGARADYDNVVIAPGARRALYQARFDAIYELDALEQLSGTWSLAYSNFGGLELAQTSTNTTARAIVGDVTDDQVLQSKLSIRSFATGSAWAGLMARFVDTRNYYYVSVRANGQISLRKVVDGWVTVLGSVPFVAGSQPMYLRLEVVGTKLRVYVNDVLLLERSDTTFTHGSSGFAMYNTVASYDDYIAYQP
jgi:hypothetical protein